MAPKDTAHEPVNTPDPVEKGMASVNTLRLGLKSDLDESRSL